MSVGNFDNVVHIWRSCLEGSTADLEQAAATLSDDEIERAQRYKFSRDRRRFVAARAFLRKTLGGYLAAPPSELEFAYGRYGKPELLASHNEATLEFNLSHSGELALLAVTTDRRVGIDVERIDEKTDVKAIALRFFSTAENTALDKIPAEDRDFSIYCGWTRKEAFLKAIGCGLARPLDKFDVSLSSAPRLLRVGDDEEASSKWTLCHLDPALGYVAALAVEGRGVQVVWR